MCAQCVSAGAAYVVPALAGLQVMKARRRRKRLAAAEDASERAPAPTAIR